MEGVWRMKVREGGKLVWSMINVVDFCSIIKLYIRRLIMTKLSVFISCMHGISTVYGISTAHGSEEYAS